MPTIVGILTFMSMINLMLSCIEHEKKIKNLGARSALFAFVPLNRTLDLHWNMQLPSKHVRAGHYLPASETPFKWCFAGGPIANFIPCFTDTFQLAPSPPE